MSEPPVVNSMNTTDSEPRPVLGPAGNKSRSLIELRKPVSKPKTKVDKPRGEVNDVGLGVGSIGGAAAKGKKAPSSVVINNTLPRSNSYSTPSILRHQRDQKVLNMSLNASCSSDASSDSSHSRVSSGKIGRRIVTPTSVTTGRRKQCGSRTGRFENVTTESDCSSEASADGSLVRKRCAWVTPNTDSSYATFHDEEWGVPVHDDKRLFELLSLSTALAELTWPTILNKRDLFREVFHNFDPIIVSKLNEKKIVAPGSIASSLLSEPKLRGFIENARHICKIIDEFGSFEKYIWGFVNHKPTVSHFRYPRQVPIKTSKAEVISKDLVRRGFRGVGPTVIYSFMQVAGITNDHLISCFRFHECIAAGDVRNRAGDDNVKDEEGGVVDDKIGLGLGRVIDDLSLSPE